MDQVEQMPPMDVSGRRSRDWLPRIYVSLLSISVVVVAAMAVGMFVMPRVLDNYNSRRHIEALLHAARSSPAAAQPDSPAFRTAEVAEAMAWWSDRIVREPARRAKFVNLWKQARENERVFMVLGQVLFDARLMTDQSDDLEFRWYRLTRLNDPNPQKRAQFVDSLAKMPKIEPELRAALDQAAEDSADEVRSELAYMLPTWSDQAWAREALARLLLDKSPLVRRNAALAVAVIADELPDSAFGRMAITSFRGDLLIMATEDEDSQARANACWALFRVHWMARSGFAMVDPQLAPPAVRQMGALVLTNMPIATDHTESIAMQQVLESMALDDPDELTRQRAGIALGLMPFRFGLSRPIDPAVVDAMMRGPNSWMTVAIGARLAGWAGVPAPSDDSDPDAQAVEPPLDLVIARTLQSPRPDIVSEQLAWSVGQMASPPPYGRSDDPEFLRRRQRAMNALTLLANPAATQPDAGSTDESDRPVATVRTRLAVARIAGMLGDPAPLEALAEQLPEYLPGGLPADTPADMACIELAQLCAPGGKLDRDKIVQRARQWAGSYSERLQRSGVLLLALLNAREHADWLWDRHQKRRTSGDEQMTTIYQQAALLALGLEQADGQGPAAAANHLHDPQRRTPGLYTMLLLAGRREALSQLLSAQAPRSALELLDHWHLRDYLALRVVSSTEREEHGPGVGLGPIPCADDALANFVARMHSWWYDTHGQRLKFVPKTRLWVLDPRD